jgi:hypothetical protein
VIRHADAKEASVASDSKVLGMTNVVVLAVGSEDAKRLKGV